MRMSILTTTVEVWDPVEASLLEWRRLCRRMYFLESRKEADAERGCSYVGEVVWGLELKANGQTRTLGVGWEWREVIPNVVALSDPLGIFSNVQLKDERGELLTRSKLVLHLNAAVGSFRWQAGLIKHLGIHKFIAA